MKLTINLLLISLVLIVGCSTPSKLIATSSTTVDHAMKAWAVYVVDGHATLKQKQQVDKAQADYYAAEDLAIAANLGFKDSADKKAWLKARDLMLANQQALIDLITTFTHKKT